MCRPGSSESWTSAAVRPSLWSGRLPTRSAGARRSGSVPETSPTASCAPTRPRRPSYSRLAPASRLPPAVSSVPRPAEAVAVGGSAASLCRLAGSRLDADAFGRSLALLATDRAAEIARRFALDEQRVRLLPAGLLILQAASELFGVALQIGRGGIREGVLLEAGA